MQLGRVHFPGAWKPQLHPSIQDDLVKGLLGWGGVLHIVNDSNLVVEVVGGQRQGRTNSLDKESIFFV